MREILNDEVRIYHIGTGQFAYIDSCSRKAADKQTIEFYSKRC